jgi:hypothetical protein
LIKGFSESKVDKVVEAAAKLDVCCSLHSHNLDFTLTCRLDILQVSCFITGTEAREQRKKVVKITTGSPQLDQMLGK